MNLTLYLLTTEPDPRRSRVAGLADLTREPLPVPVFGERLDLTIYLLDAASAYNAASGAAGIAPTLSLGRRGETALATTTAFTRIANGWTCTLDLTTNELAFALRQCRGSAPLALSFTTVAAGPAPSIWLSGDITVLGSIADPAPGAALNPTAYYTATQVDAIIALAPRTLVAKNIPILTTGAPADIAALIIPAGITRWALPCFNSEGFSPAYIIAESGAADLSAATFDVRSAPSGAGALLVNSWSGPNPPPIVSTGFPGGDETTPVISTASTVTIRQTTNSAHAGVCSFYLTIFPLP